MRKTFQTHATGMFLFAAVGAQLFAGGFFIGIGNPAANPEARAKNAVLVARVAGCGDAAHAKVSATAEGLVNGRRESVALNPIPLSGAGMYAVKQEWPADGDWAVKLIASSEGRLTSAVVRIRNGAFDPADAKYFGGRIPTDDEVAAVLAGGKQPAARARAAR